MLSVHKACTSHRQASSPNQTFLHPQSPPCPKSLASNSISIQRERIHVCLISRSTSAYTILPLGSKSSPQQLASLPGRQGPDTRIVRSTPHSRHPAATFNPPNPSRRGLDRDIAANKPKVVAPSALNYRYFHRLDPQSPNAPYTRSPVAL